MVANKVAGVNTTQFEPKIDEIYFRSKHHTYSNRYHLRNNRGYRWKWNLYKSGGYFDRFDITDVTGHLGYIAQGTRFDYFSLKENPDIFYDVGLNDIVLRDDNENGLRYSATIGDSIIKHSHSDTLILIKNGTKIYYKIERPFRTH